MNINLQSPIYALFAIALLYSGTAWGQAHVDRASSIRIQTSSDATPTERFAAGELAKYINAVLGAKVAALGDVDSERGITISVGRTDLNESLLGRFHDVPVERLHDSFIVKVSNDSISLLGGGDRGTLYAVYAFLEQIGCRWFGPFTWSQVVPRVDSITIRSQDQLQVPHFIQRSIDGSAPPGVAVEAIVDWSAKKRLNHRFAVRYYHLRRAYPDDPAKWNAWSIRGEQIKWQWLCHNLAFMLPRSLFETHPQLFSLYNHRRIPPGTDKNITYGGGNPCTTHPDVIKRCADFAIDWFNKHPSGTIVPLWPGDGPIKWCE